MRDYTVISYYLPKTFQQYHDEISLKCAIWTQIQEKFRDLKKLGLCDEEVDSSIVEINLGYNGFEAINPL